LACLYLPQISLAADIVSPAKRIVFINSEDHYGSYMYELIDQDYKFPGKVKQFDRNYKRSFYALVSPLVANEKKFINKITSGPSTKGKFFVVDGKQYVVHMTCQANDCAYTNLAVMYRIGDGRMVGQLWEKCKTTLLGGPSAQEVSVLKEVQHVSREDGDCE